MTGLFPGEQFESADAARPALDVRVVGVAVQANVWGDFDYAWPAPLGVEVTKQHGYSDKRGKQ